jgi:tetratricopeptide (TPR) repeat protein
MTPAGPTLPEGEVGFQLAMAAARRGDHAEAEELARRIRASTADPTLQARLANLLGGVAFERGRLEEAEAWLELVLQGGPAVAEPLLVARASNNLASIAHLRGKGALSLSLYRSALAAWERAGDPAGEAQTCHNLGIVAAEQGELAEAAKDADRAVAAARRTPDLALRGLTLMGRAEIALARGMLAEARSDHTEARELARRSGDGLGIADADRLGGRVALAEGDVVEGLRLARSAYRRANLLGAVQLAAECAELCARASRSLPSGEAAARYRVLATRHYAALGARPALRRLAREANR